MWDASEVSELRRWNLFKTKQPPYNEIEDGASVVLVDTWPGGSRLVWLTEVYGVFKKDYSSKISLSILLAMELQLERELILGNSYFAAGPDRGVALAMRFRPLKRLGSARPKDLRFRPNGWLRVDDDAQLAKWNLRERRTDG